MRIGTTTIRYYRRDNDSWQNVSNIIGVPASATDIETAVDDAIALIPTIPHYVDAADLEQTNSNKDITATITDVTAYSAGTTLIFEVEGTNDTANVRLRINSLAYKKLLKSDGTEFLAQELEINTEIIAFYNGTEFKSNVARRSQVHFLDATEVTRVGDAYSITDTTIQGTGIGSPIIVAFKAEVDNVGDVTLSLNNSLGYAVLLSDGSQIPAGALKEGYSILLVFGNVGTVGWRAVNIMPARSLKGKLMATLSIPAGDYTGDYGYWGGWTLESGVTEVTLADRPGTPPITDALVVFPNTRSSTSQLGWYFEVVNGTMILFDSFKNFGESEILQQFIQITSDMEWVVSTPPANSISGVSNITLSFKPTSIFNVDVLDDIKVNLYISEN